MSLQHELSMHSSFYGKAMPACKKLQNGAVMRMRFILCSSLKRRLGLHRHSTEENIFSADNNILWGENYNIIVCIRISNCFTGKSMLKYRHPKQL